MQELVKLSLICGLRSTGWTESNEHVAVAPPIPPVPWPGTMVTSLTSRHTPAPARRCSTAGTIKCADSACNTAWNLATKW